MANKYSVLVDFQERKVLEVSWLTPVTSHEPPLNLLSLGHHLTVLTLLWPACSLSSPPHRGKGDPVG